jgi:hypothetical protein
MECACLPRRCLSGRQRWSILAITLPTLRLFHDRSVLGITGREALQTFLQKGNAFFTASPRNGTAIAKGTLVRPVRTRRGKNQGEQLGRRAYFWWDLGGTCLKLGRPSCNALRAEGARVQTSLQNTQRSTASTSLSQASRSTTA